jgi:hypothetical protein
MKNYSPCLIEMVTLSFNFLLMNKRTIDKVNGGIAIYYGIMALLGAIGGVIGIGIWIYKVLNKSTGFSWGVLITLIIATIVLGFIGYAILKVGHE